MAKNFLYADANGFFTEAAAYEQSDHISTSTGAADAGKPIVLDAQGHIDASMINDADIDHGLLTGLADDDHTQYILVAGTRAFTGSQSMGGFNLTNVADPTATTIDAASSDAVPMSFLASTATGEGASVIGIEDAGGYYNSSDVEGALQELANAFDFVNYTVASATSVAKGDLLYISANDTAATLSDITQPETVIGMAESAVTGPGTVRALQSGEIATGVLTAATAGTRYFWDGTSLVTSIPAGSGKHIWLAGTAKNATDLHLNIQFIRKNL